MNLLSMLSYPQRVSARARAKCRIMKNERTSETDICSESMSGLSLLWCCCCCDDDAVDDCAFVLRFVPTGMSLEVGGGKDIARLQVRAPEERGCGCARPRKNARARALEADACFLQSPH